MSLIENFVQNHVDLLKRNDYIDPSLYKEYGVKSGLRRWQRSPCGTYEHFPDNLGKKC